MMSVSESNLSLNRCYLAHSQDQAHRDYISGICLKTASIVAVVASAVLASYIYLFCSFMPDPSSATFPVLAALSVVGAIPIPMFAAGLWNKGNTFFENAKNKWKIIELEQELKKRFVKDGELNLERANEEFKEKFGIVVNQKILDRIKEGLGEADSAKKATQAWIHVAAHFIFELEMACKKFPEIKEPQGLSEEERVAWRAEKYTEQHVYEESHTMKHILNAALFRLILEKPFTQATELSDLGRCEVRPFITRARDPDKDNHYFIFKKREVSPIPVTGALLELARYLPSIQPTDSLNLLDMNLDGREISKIADLSSALKQK